MGPMDTMGPMRAMGSMSAMGAMGSTGPVGQPLAHGEKIDDRMGVQELTSKFQEFFQNLTRTYPHGYSFVAVDSNLQK